MRRPSARRQPGFSSPALTNRINFMRSHLECGESAVDGVVAAGDERGSVGTEKERELGHFVGAAHASDGLSARELVEHLGFATWIVLGEESVDEWRMDSR